MVGAAGTFALTFNGDTTAPVAYGASPAAVAAALNALPSVAEQVQGSGDHGLVTVNGTGIPGNPYLVTFEGMWSGQAVPLLSANTSALVGAINTVATSYNADGEITATGDNFSHYAYTYTGQGDVASVDNAGTPGVPDVVLTSGYDPAGNRKSLSATISGTKDFLTSYSYNTLSQLDEIDQQGQSGGNAVAMKSIYFGLDPIGDITQIDRSNSVFSGPQQNGPAYSLLTYSPTTGLLTGINHEYMGASLDNLSYTYDPLARVSTFGSIDGTASYGYDGTSQVISSSYTTAPGGHQPANEARSYDPNGNQTTSGFTVGADNHLSSDGTFNFTFDSAGNLSTRVRISNATAADYKTVYLWDYRDRLTDVEFFNNSGTLTQHVHYAYDIWDHLIERDLDPNGSGTYTQIVQYVWDSPLPPGEGQGEGNIVLAFDGHQNLIARYLNGPDTSAYDQYFSTLAEEDVTSPTSPGPVSYSLLDKQGTSRDEVDASGNLIDHENFSSTGLIVFDSNPSAPRLTSWQGGMLDAVTGQELFRRRWENMVDAVWDSEDPIGFPAGDTNLSRVDANDPTNLTDPSGEHPALIVGALAAGYYFFFGSEKLAHTPEPQQSDAYRAGLEREAQAETMRGIGTAVSFSVGGFFYGRAGSMVGSSLLGRGIAGGGAAACSMKLTEDVATGFGTGTKGMSPIVAGLRPVLGEKGLLNDRDYIFTAEFLSSARRSLRIVHRTTRLAGRFRRRSVVRRFAIDGAHRRLLLIRRRRPHLVRDSLPRRDAATDGVIHGHSGAISA